MATQYVLRNRIKVARAERDISQDDLAKLVGVTRQTIGSVESLQYCPSTKLALTIAMKLDKKVDDIFYLEAKDV